MAYRKIEVNGLDCEYTIGRSHVKIKIPGHKSLAILKETIGSKLDPEASIAVTPADIRLLIEATL